MAAELGDTKDPKELIPGDTGDLESVADSLRKASGKFEDTGTQLGGVRVADWSGKASDQFWEKFSGEKKNWLYAADAMSDAASAVSKYASALSGAQQRAADAIDLWDSGDEAQARTVLNAARQSLKEEAGTAGKKLADLAGGASDAPSWLTRAGEVAEQQKESGKGSRTFFERESKPVTDPRIGRGRTREFGTTNSEEPGGNSEESGGKKHGPEVKLWERKGEASVWGAEAEGEKQVGDGKLSGKAGLKLLGAEGTVGASYKEGNLEAKIGGTAYLAKASAEGSYENGPAAVKGDATAFAGLDASATAAVGKEGAHLGAEAFAGAKATASGHADVGGIGAGATAEGWAGAGAEAHVDAGMKDGKFVIGGSVGVGLGLGGKVGAQIEIDPHKVADTVSDAADAIGDGLESVGDGLKSLNPFG